jgi:transcriptional regulator with XRE-family HTH domain
LIIEDYGSEIMNGNEIVAKNLRMLRKIRGLSQIELAKKTSLSNTYICEMESGQLNISIKVVERLAKALEVPLKMLFEEDLLALPLSAFERFPYEPEEKEKLRVEKEKAKEKLRRDFKKLKTALEAFELEVKG